MREGSRPPSPPGAKSRDQGRGQRSGEPGAPESALPPARPARRALAWSLSSVAVLGVVAAAGLVGAAEPAVSEAEGAAHFAQAATVLQHPRCRNCHPAGDAPLHGDEGVPHAMHVRRSSPAAGLHCTTCHRGKNTDFEHGPPGALNWHMPPTETPMVFEGLPVSELCARFKDPAKNGGRTLAALAEHVGHDPLVLWAWSPGPGRTSPPMSHAAFTEHIRRWAEAGGPCPAPKGP